MTWTRLRDVRLIPVVFGPLVAVLAVAEARLGALPGGAWLPGVGMGAALVLAAWRPWPAPSSRPSACLPARSSSARRAARPRR
ncbi:unnamed protein product [[Actinomadura] parvosata subsp. kistnae]|uniref:hypothetical protein n=1 Tax=[Actinomadura] parvosata TaxID=1955412 RepID=UPI000D2EEDF3|nr:unnamed protein product [Actinomadura parvosata subsp. kistnae]